MKHSILNYTRMQLHYIHLHFELCELLQFMYIHVAQCNVYLFVKNANTRGRGS